MSSSIMSKLDEMGRRVDVLEQDLNGLAVQAGIEVSQSKESPSSASAKQSMALSLTPTSSTTTSLPSPSGSAVEI